MKDQNSAHHLPVHIVPVALYALVYLALMVLLGVTLAVYHYVHLSSLNMVLSLIIAASKAILVILIFMHARYASPLVRIFAAAGFVWLAVLIGFSLSDYMTRDPGLGQGVNQNVQQLIEQQNRDQGRPAE